MLAEALLLHQIRKQLAGVVAISEFQNTIMLQLKAYLQPPIRRYASIGDTGAPDARCDEERRRRGRGGSNVYIMFETWEFIR